MSLYLNSKVRSSGFTLIELVVVIVLIGTLSAFALPKFADNTEVAQIAVLENYAGTMKSAVAIARTKFRVNGGLRNNVALEGANNEASNFRNIVDFSAEGCPVQHWRINSETNPTTGNANDCLTVFTFLTNQCNSNATNCGLTPDETFAHAYLGSGVCEYRYRDNEALRILYDTSSASCSVTTSGF